jgi:hypothetical protein
MGYITTHFIEQYQARHEQQCRVLQVKVNNGMIRKDKQQMNYKIWKWKENIANFIDPERSIPNDAPYYRTQSHIDWIESGKRFGCPGAVNSYCKHFKRGCSARNCEHYPKSK